MTDLIQERHLEVMYQTPTSASNNQEAVPIHYESQEQIISWFRDFVSEVALLLGEFQASNDIYKRNKLKYFLKAVYYNRAIFESK